MRYSGGIKRNATDDLFSDIVRMRAKWICESCRRDFSNFKHKFDCSHFITRGNQRTRWDFENASALCRGCHDRFTGDPLEHYEFMRNKIGQARINLLRIRSNRKLTEFRVDEKLIRQALKIELKRMQDAEKAGIFGAR